MRRLLGVLAVVCSAVALAACGSSSSGSSESNSGGDTAAMSTASAIPSDIVLSSPTETVTAANSSLSKALVKGDAPPEDGRKRGDPLDHSYMQKKEALHDLMSGDGDCSFTMSMPEAPPPECYGPVVNATNHPEGAAQYGYPPGDLGFWNSTEDGTEACAAAKMNQLVRNVASKVDNMINTLGVAACAANKAEVALPAVGATLDLTTMANEQADVEGLTFTQASIQRLADTPEGYAVYVSTVAMTMVFPDGTASGEIILKHIPTVSDGSTYKGKLSMRMGFSSANFVQDCPAGSTGTTMAGVIQYEKAAANDLKYQFNYVPLCGGDVDPFDADNNISPAVTTWVHDWNYGLFNLNPVNGTGSGAYAWQAGLVDNRTRVFNVNVSANADGSASGKAYYGFGPDIASASPIGTIDGFVCNWAGPNGAVGRSAAEALAQGKGWNKAQRQELSRAVGTTIFVPATSNIKYAPTNNCDTNDAAFRYQAVSQEGGAPLNFSNDRTTAVEVLDDLIDLGAIDFTRPTAPVDVGGSS